MLVFAGAAPRRVSTSSGKKIGLPHIERRLQTSCACPFAVFSRREKSIHQRCFQLWKLKCLNGQKKQVWCIPKSLFSRENAGKIHIHQRGFKVFVGDLRTVLVYRFWPPILFPPFFLLPQGISSGKVKVVLGRNPSLLLGLSTFPPACLVTSLVVTSQAWWRLKVLCSLLKWRSWPRTLPIAKVGWNLPSLYKLMYPKFVEVVPPIHHVVVDWTIVLDWSHAILELQITWVFPPFSHFAAFWAWESWRVCSHAMDNHCKR